MLKFLAQYRSRLSRLAPCLGFALVFCSLALILLWLPTASTISSELRSSVVFDEAAQNQIKPYIESAKVARNNYRRAIGQGNGGAYDKYQEAASCTTHLAAQIEAVKELRSDYQQLDEAIGYADYIQGQRMLAKTQSEVINTKIGAAFDINDTYWIKLKNAEVEARNKLAAANAAVGDCLTLYDNATEKCLQQKADWDKAQEEYAKVALEIKNAVKTRELETIQNIQTKYPEENNAKTSSFDQKNWLQSGLLSSTIGAVGPSGRCGVIGSGAVCMPTNLYLCPDGWQGYTGGGDCFSGYKCCVQTVNNSYQSQTTQPAQTGLLGSLGISNLVSNTATSFLGSLLPGGGSINLGGQNWNVGFEWPSNNGSTAIITGPGAAKGLTAFKNNYKGNTYQSAIGMITGWTNFALTFVSVIAIAALVYAGFLYITAFGNEEQTGKAKKIILWVVLGIVIIISAYAIVNTLIGSGSSSGEDGGSASMSVGDSSIDISL